MTGHTTFTVQEVEEHHQDASLRHKIDPKTPQRMDDESSFPGLDETEESFLSASSSSTTMGQTYDLEMPAKSPLQEYRTHILPLLLTGGLFMLVGYALHHDRDEEEENDVSSFHWLQTVSSPGNSNNNPQSSTRFKSHSELFPQTSMAHILLSALTVFLGYHLPKIVGKQWGNIASQGRNCSHSTTSSSRSSPSQRGRRRTTSPDQSSHGNGPVLALTLEDDCFVPLDTLADITLADVAYIFDFCNQLPRLPSPEKDSIASYVAQQEERQQQSPLRSSLVSVLEHLQHAVQTSRGPQVSMAHDNMKANTSTSCVGGDSMDALYLCGAIRLFAEWRSLRAIPSGYNKFAFGMTLTRRDVLQNAHKLEQAVHAYLEDTGSTTTPTLRQLLEYEVESNKHPRLPCVEEQTAGSGVLWATRQIIYYGKVLENNAQVPIRFPDPRAAYQAAYEVIYGPVHTFWTRTMIMTTIDSVPHPQEVLREMNVPYGDETGSSNDSSHEPPASNSITEDTESMGTATYFDDENDDDDEDDITIMDSERTPQPQQHAEEAEIEDSIRHNAELEWGERVLQAVVPVLGHCMACDQNDPSSSEDARDRDALASDFTPSVTNGIRNDVPHYRQIMKPLEDDWIQLITDVNMDDPTRV